MTNNNWTEIKAILEQLLEIPASERVGALDAMSLTPDVRAEVESLMSVETDSEAFLSTPAIEFSKDMIDDGVAGQEIGPYRIIRELGYGGMGAVYLAERIDGKFSQRVALKMLKRELNTETLRRRFQHEREILASLEHTHIARLLDAGTTDDKVPYIAMEYVDGQPIDEYCDQHSLDLNARLELFRTVCATVNFAHQNLVVHRDLKPSNILVTDDGDTKLLDFGIAKLLSSDADSTSTVTKLGVMTPSYASPEQLRNESVTTATDVYSLGVILYELLSGHRPFEAKEGDIKEIYQAVAEVDPPLASEVWREETANGANSTNGKRSGQTTRSNVNAALIRGDLDNIILKALKKEPERRYSSAENLAADIKRHLDGLPVTARPDTFSYRAEKFVKRNKFSVVAGSLIALVLIGGISATLWQSRVAAAERSRAEKRFNDVRALANSFLFEFNPKIENLPGSMPARQLLVTRALEYLDNLSQETGNDLQLKSELAKAYEKVGEVQGNPDMPNIGDVKGALLSYEKALVIRREQLAASPNNSDVMSDLANNLEVTANINLNGGAYEKSGAELAEAVALREKIVEQKPTDITPRALLAKVLRTSGFVPFYEGEVDKASAFFDRSLALVEQLEKEAPDDALVGYLHANLYIDIGDSFGYKEDLKTGSEKIQQGLEMFERLVQKHPNDVKIRRSLQIAHLKRAGYYRETDNMAASLKSYDTSLAMAEESVKNNPGSFQAKRDVVLVAKQRAVTLRAAKRYADSL
ncbi:MAG: serine/threonine protein kinase, partial [Blastocatellia bacterium]|nr:serine/threonine protein kinase [Blastocatellia bacterium]